MSAIRTNAAAAMLGVSANTLRSWERRFGYPAPRRTDGGHRQFELADIEALRSAFREIPDISSAIAVARERGAGGSSHCHLQSAFADFCAEKADAVLAESLAVRSVERTVEAVLLPAVEALVGERPPGPPPGQFDRRPLESRARGRRSHPHGPPGPRRERVPEYCFAWRYSTGWLAAAHRVAPPATHPEGVLIFDATEQLQLDALHVQALELFLRRRGLHVLSLPTALEPARMGNALRALRPSLLVLAGSSTTLDVIARLIYAARQAVGDAEVLDFRGALPDTGASTVGRLGATAMAAAEGVCERLYGSRTEQPRPGASATEPPDAGLPAAPARGRQGQDEAALSAALGL